MAVPLQKTPGDTIGSKTAYVCPEIEFVKHVRYIFNIIHVSPNFTQGPANENVKNVVEVVCRSNFVYVYFYLLLCSMIGLLIFGSITLANAQ